MHASEIYFTTDTETVLLYFSNYIVQVSVELSYVLKMYYKFKPASLS